MSVACDDGARDLTRRFGDRRSRTVVRRQSARQYSCGSPPRTAQPASDACETGLREDRTPDCESTRPDATPPTSAGTTDAIRDAKRGPMKPWHPFRSVPECSLRIDVCLGHSRMSRIAVRGSLERNQNANLRDAAALQRSFAGATAIGSGPAKYDALSRVAKRIDRTVAVVREVTADRAGGPDHSLDSFVSRTVNEKNRLPRAPRSAAGR